MPSSAPLTGYQYPITSQRLLERFIRYVKIDSTADENSPTVPTTPGQLEMGRLLCAELRKMGLQDANQSPQGVVTATIPATLPPGDASRIPVVAFNSHVDTSPEASGKNIQPQLHVNYAGGDIRLPAGPVITLAEHPELADLIGDTIITSDGSTLLGSDDKSGVAVIMELAQWLVEHPEILHGDIRVLFTCDEEIGHGVDHVDLKSLAADVAYTLDGRGRDEIENETFSADLAIVNIRGVNTHPSIGKGRMVNAIRAAGFFLRQLPQDRHSPETTAERQGFLHPYAIYGGVAETELKIILRDFHTPQLAVWAEMLATAATATEREFAGTTVEVKIVKQYRNMADGLAKEPRAVELAERALHNLGRTPRLGSIRGGTDGAHLTEQGLPTPNLSTGEHNPHSPLEWSSLHEMCLAVEMLIELVQLWGRERKT
ncbi:MAG: peptidase T [Pirellulales bacterium]|nr:peptidase T [Pirellulales bacterium]